MTTFIRIFKWIVMFINSCSSIILICIICPRIIEHDNLGFDYMGVIVAILAFLVTLLVGWQIWQTVDLRSKIDTIDDKMRKSREDYDHEISGALFHIYALHYMNDNKYDNALTCLMNGIREQNKSSRPVYLKNILRLIYEQYEKFNISPSQQKDLVTLLEKTECKDNETNKYRLLLLAKLKGE